MTKTLVQTLNLKNFTTLKVGGPAEVWEVETLGDLQKATQQPYKVIGAGSNLLVSDAGVKERVIKLGQTFNSLKEFTTQKDLWLGASTPLPGLIRRTQQAGLSGLEGLLGVPAVLGGAIAMNAGTRYGEMSDTLQEVEVFVNGNLERLPASALGLRYRHSEVPEGAVITKARLKLTESTPDNVQVNLDQVDAARKGQPKQKSAGCAFKNPIGYSAGKLIDEAGLKGLKVGDAMVSLEHGNFIVNLGNASAKDVLALLDLIRQRISNQTNDAVMLETEWQLWGF